MSSANGPPRIRIGDLLKLEYGSSLPSRARDAGDIPVVGSNGIVGRHSIAVTRVRLNRPGVPSPIVVKLISLPSRSPCEAYIKPLYGPDWISCAIHQSPAWRALANSLGS